MTAGTPLHRDYLEENVDLVVKGCSNLSRHIENAKLYGCPVIIAINQFATDAPSELAAVKKAALEAGADDAVVCNHHGLGGAGAVELAEAVVKASSQASDFKFLYDVNLSIKEKIEAIAIKTYRAAKVEYSPQAEAQIQRYTEMGFGRSIDINPSG